LEKSLLSRHREAAPKEQLNAFFVLPGGEKPPSDKQIASNPRAGWSVPLPATDPRAARAFNSVPV